MQVGDMESLIKALPRGIEWQVQMNFGKSLDRKPFGLIPCRMESTRFPGKPLALINGVEMIQHVYERVKEVDGMSGCALCTDSQEIIEFAKERDINVVATGKCHTGSDRVLEAAKLLGKDLVINVQGDEPLISKDFLEELCTELVDISAREDDDKPVVLSAYCSATEEETNCKNVVKVMINSMSEGIAFSRLPLCSAVVDGIRCVYKQIGVYGYNLKGLELYGELGYSQLEETEKVELMRWIDFVGPIRMVRSRYPAYSVDTIEDLIKVENLMSHSAKGRLS